MTQKEPIDNILHAAASGIKNAYNKTMDEENKNLLLKELSARLPYGVMCLVNTHVERLDMIIADDNAAGFGFQSFDVNEVKLYLRPMSSMTEEENDEWRDHWFGSLLKSTEVKYPESQKYLALSHVESVEWLLKHHFDFNDLIEKGLALEAPKNMYE